MIIKPKKTKSHNILVGPHCPLPTDHPISQRLDAAGMGELKMTDKPCICYEPWNRFGVNIKECIEYDAKEGICHETLSEHNNQKCPWWGMPGYEVEPRTLKEKSK